MNKIFITSTQTNRNTKDDKHNDYMYILGELNLKEANLDSKIKN